MNDAMLPGGRLFMREIARQEKFFREMEQRFTDWNTKPEKKDDTVDVTTDAPSNAELSRDEPRSGEESA